MLTLLLKNSKAHVAVISRSQQNVNNFPSIHVHSWLLRFHFEISSKNIVQLEIFFKFLEFHYSNIDLKSQQSRVFVKFHKVALKSSHSQRWKIYLCFKDFRLM